MIVGGGEIEFGEVRTIRPERFPDPADFSIVAEVTGSWTKPTGPKITK